MRMAGVAVRVCTYEDYVVVLLAFVNQALMCEVIQHLAVNTALLNQVGVDPPHVLVLFRQFELRPDAEAWFHRFGRYVLTQQHLYGVLKAGVIIFLDEVNRSAALLLVLVEELVTAYGDVMVSPFQLRAGAPQLLSAGFEENGEVGVLGVVELLRCEGDII